MVVYVKLSNLLGYKLFAISAPSIIEKPNPYFLPVQFFGYFYIFLLILIEPAFRGGSCKKCLLNLIGSLQSGSLRSCNRLH